MLISYCITCHGRLWQLIETLKHNLKFTQSGFFEICVLLYNDESAYEYLVGNYKEYLEDGRLRIKVHNEDRVFEDGTRWSCGYAKDLSHKMGKGRVLFNLDADNFIDSELRNSLLDLDANEILITEQSEWLPDGRSGRIGVHRCVYGKVRYRDRGRSDDGDFIGQCIGIGLKVKQVSCFYKPISNEFKIREV